MKQFADEATAFSTRILRGAPERRTASGTLVFDKGYGVYLRVLWTARFDFPQGAVGIEYERNLPEGKTWAVDSVPLNARTDYQGHIIWRFLCPRQFHPKCKKVIQKLYLSDTGLFGCMVCADVNYRCRRISDHSLHGLFNDPKAMIKILSSKTVPMTRKLKVMEIARRALARRDRLKRKLKRLERRLKSYRLRQHQPDTHSDTATQ